jgi:hypothetical protein
LQKPEGDGILEGADTLSSNMYTRSNGVMTVEAQRVREAAEVQLEHLEKLGEELSRRGMQVRLVLPPGRVPSWWSWAERISSSDDLDAAATAIVRVLASHPSA